MDAVNWLRTAPDGVILTVKATPRATRDEVVGCEDGWLRVRLRAPPVEGKANAALTAFLAERLDVPRRAVTLLAGDTARVKRLRIAGIDAAQTRARLGL